MTTQMRILLMPPYSFLGGNGSSWVFKVWIAYERKVIKKRVRKGPRPERESSW